MRRALLSAALLAVLVPGLALASLVGTASIVDVVGPEPAPGEASAFTGSFNVSASPTDLLIDCFRIRTVSGPSFNAPAVLSAMPAGWSSLWEYPNDAAAEGPGVNPLTYNVTWAGALQSFSYVGAYYGNGSWIGSVLWAYDVNTNSWTTAASQWNPGKDPAPTPEPATWFSLIAGLGVLGWMRFRG